MVLLAAALRPEVLSELPSQALRPVVRSTANTFPGPLRASWLPQPAGGHGRARNPRRHSFPLRRPRGYSHGNQVYTALKRKAASNVPHSRPETRSICSAARAAHCLRQRVVGKCAIKNKLSKFKLLIDVFISDQNDIRRSSKQNDFLPHVDVTSHVCRDCKCFLKKNSLQG